MTRYSVPILVILLAAGCQSNAPTCDPFFGRTVIPPPGTGSATGQCPDPYYQTPYQTPPVVEMPTASTAAATTNPPNSPATAAQTDLFPGTASPLSAPRPLSTGAPSSASRTIPPPGTSGGYPSSPATSASRGLASPQPEATAPQPRKSSPATDNSTAPSSSPGWLPSGASSSNADRSPPAVTVSLPASSRAAGDRSPRPIDSAGAGESPAARQPIVRTLEPRQTSENAGQVRDIMDLPPAD